MATYPHTWEPVMSDNPQPRAAVETLPPYSGSDTTCVKCGNKGAFTEYLGHGKCLHDPVGTVLGFEPNERLHRQCSRCDYAWDEATAIAASIGDRA